MIAASGPDQGQAFLNTLNPINAQAIMVPDGWFGGEQNALSHVMVQDYIAKFGGTSSDINADVAEAYSAGEILADAVTATHGTDNARSSRTCTASRPRCRPCRDQCSSRRTARTPPSTASSSSGKAASSSRCCPRMRPGRPIVAAKPQWDRRMTGRMT